VNLKNINLKTIILLAVLLTGVLSACDTNKSTTPKLLDSALGDTTTLTSKIANTADFEQPLSTLVLKAMVAGDPMLIGEVAEGTIKDDGSFSIDLPGQSVMKNYLATTQTLTDCPGTDSPTLTPATTKGASLGLSLWQGDEEVAYLAAFVLAAPNDFMSSPKAYAGLLYVDTDSSITGTLSKECIDLEAEKDLPVKVELRQGWNSVVIDSSEGFVNKKLGTDISWLAFLTFSDPN
jgi:hypothetical protein